MSTQNPDDNKQPEVLDDATAAAIREGLESEANGHFLSMNEVVEFARERRKAWQAVPQVAA
ncbi:MAG TPA: hypothetical protein VGK19_02205 [Capsulimonadaceae bacterium]|jgi:predicted transcriptional regulator